MTRILSIFAFLFIFQSAYTCTNFLITKSASTEGTNMISYSADSHELYGELYYWRAATHPEGTMLDVYEWDTGRFLGKIPQVRQTYNVVGNMNEFQVAIGETTYGGLKELSSQDGAIMDYGSLMYIALQRSRSAREAIKVIADLMEKYGYASSGESFSIMDKNEVWIMEMIGKGNYEKGAVWVAVMIPDGYISAHANQARIMQFPRTYKQGAISSKEWDKLFDPKVTTIYSHDVVSFAVKNGFYKGKDKDFSFSDVYAPMDFGAARFCEARVWSMFKQVNSDMDKYENYAKGHDLTNRMPLFIKPERKISLQDMIEFMGDHYGGTSLDFSNDPGAGPHGLPYRWRPLTWEVDGVRYFNERSTATQQTGFSFIAQARSDYPDPIGGILWFGVDDAYYTVYAPLFCGIIMEPPSFKKGFGSMLEFNHDAAFWVFNQVANLAYTRFNVISPIIKEHQAKLTDRFLKTIGPVSTAATILYETDKELAIDYITEYSVRQAEYTVDHWKKLYGFLFAKFVDGNIKQSEGMKLLDNGNGKNIPAKVGFPGYDEATRRAIIRQTGDRYRVRE